MFKIKLPRILKRVDVLVLRAYIGPFMVTFVLSMFLFLMQFLWKYIDELVGKGIEPLILAQLIFYSLADLVPMALPLTVMVAGLMTFGNLSESFELVAMKANGLSLGRILLPVLILMIMLGGINFYFMNRIIPRANLEAKALLWDLRQKKPAFNIKEGVFYQQIENFSIRVGKKEKDEETIHDILIYEYKMDDSKRLNVLRAEDGTMKLSDDKRILFFTLNNGVRYDEMTGSKDYNRTSPFNMMRFKTQRMAIDLSSLDLKFTERDAYKGDYRLMNIGELNKEIDSFDKKEIRLLKENRMFISRFFHLGGLYGFKGDETLKNDSIFKPRKADDLLQNFKGEMARQVLQQAITNARSLKGTIDGLVSSRKFDKEEISPYMAEWHKKFTLSVIVILLFLISAPLGAIIRKGGIGMPLVISVLLFVFFYAINLVGEKIGKEGVVPIWAGMWMSSLVLLPIGMFITYKATRDSAVMNIDIYVRFLGKIPGIKWMMARLKKKPARTIASSHNSKTPTHENTGAG